MFFKGRACSVFCWDVCWGPGAQPQSSQRFPKGSPAQIRGREPCPGGSPGPGGVPLTSAHRGRQFLPSPTPGCDNPGYLQILPGAPCGDTVTLQVRATGLSYRREQIQSSIRTLAWACLNKQRHVYWPHWTFPFMTTVVLIYTKILRYKIMSGASSPTYGYIFSYLKLN